MLSSRYTAGGADAASAWFNPQNVLLTDPGSRARVGGPSKEERDAEFFKDLNKLTRILTQMVSQYGSSENLGDREMAEIYASYLDRLKDANGRYVAVRDYRRGAIPGLSSPRPAQMPPAWS